MLTALRGNGRPQWEWASANVGHGRERAQNRPNGAYGGVVSVGQWLTVPLAAQWSEWARANGAANAAQWGRSEAIGGPSGAIDSEWEGVRPMLRIDRH